MVLMCRLLLYITDDHVTPTVAFSLVYCTCRNTDYYVFIVVLIF